MSKILKTIAFFRSVISYVGIKKDKIRLKTHLNNNILPKMFIFLRIKVINLSVFAIEFSFYPIGSAEFEHKSMECLGIFSLSQMVIFWTISHPSFTTN